MEHRQHSLVRVEFTQSVNPLKIFVHWILSHFHLLDSLALPNVWPQGLRIYLLAQLPAALCAFSIVDIALVGDGIYLSLVLSISLHVLQRLLCMINQDWLCLSGKLCLLDLRLTAIRLIYWLVISLHVRIRDDLVALLWIAIEIGLLH